jgi:hypothetical protein
MMADIGVNVNEALKSYHDTANFNSDFNRRYESLKALN